LVLIVGRKKEAGQKGEKNSTKQLRRKCRKLKAGVRKGGNEIHHPQEAKSKAGKEGAG